MKIFNNLNNTGGFTLNVEPHVRLEEKDFVAFGAENNFDNINDAPDWLLDKLALVTYVGGHPEMNTLEYILRCDFNEFIKEEI